MMSFNDEKKDVEPEQPIEKPAKKKAASIPVSKVKKLLTDAQKELEKMDILSVADHHNSAMITERILVLQELLGIIKPESK